MVADGMSTPEILNAYPDLDGFASETWRAFSE
jgi:hypothetical protein